MIAAARAWFTLYRECSIGWDAETETYGVWHPVWFWLRLGFKEVEDVDVTGVLAELAVKAALDASPE